MVEWDPVAILVCPENRAPVRPADPALLARINEAIDSRRLSNRAGRVIDKRLEAALVRMDRAIAYPIRDGIPVLLTDEGIVLNLEPSPKPR